MPDEEWFLLRSSLETALEFRRLQAESELGHTRMVLARLDSLCSAPGPGPDYHGTMASLLWLKGSILLAEGDTTGALRGFAASVIEGDVRNKWSGLSLESMEEILLPDISPLRWARETMEYTGPVFVDLTGLLGPRGTLHGSRVSWCDWNADGYPDLYAGNTLFQNEGGTSFSDVTTRAGLDDCTGNGGIWGDLNGDGLEDLVTAGNPVQVFLNDGGTMVEVTAEIGVDTSAIPVEGIGLLDWNADGWPDLYLACYEVPGELGAGMPDLFYLGSEKGFTEASDSLGMVPFLGKHLCGRGVSPCDFDGDGDIDVFVSNYRLQENFLWENVEGFAVNTALERGVAGTETEGWWGHTIGSAWSDYDNDGDWDLFSANLAHPRDISVSDRSMLLENRDGTFTDVRAAAGIKFEETHSNPTWGDFDNDGLTDLYLTSVYPDRRSFLYRNTGDGTFADVTWLSGTRVMNGWGVATADFNLDGRLDLAVGTGDGPVLLSNVTRKGNWALVKVLPPGNCNPSGLGCIVVLEQDGNVLKRQVEGGSGTTSQNGSLLHFGLPDDGPFTIKLLVPGSPLPVYVTRGKPGRIITAGIRNPGSLTHSSQ